MADNENSGSGASFIKGFLLGGLIGAGFALLNAPKTGKEMRKDLKKKRDELMADAEVLYSEAKEKSVDLMGEGLKSAERLRKEAEKLLEEARIKAAELIEESQKIADEIKQKAGEVIDDSSEIVKKGKDSVTKTKGKLKQAIDSSREAFNEEIKGSKNKE